MLDTNVAIHLRDGDERIGELIRATSDTLAFSIVTVVELEAGLSRKEADLRSLRLEALLQTVEVRPFDRRDAAAYGRIVREAGFSRRKVLDRMIAAQAIVDEAVLVTMNGDDFRDIPGLTLLEW
ncbi:PIN domain-containing protein [Brevundimonas sp. PAMC22021]|uniref:PIN domain-containing protein n=1 Tax=Brevundimonas sp. PAMC22021 TaxID=2861285 RepID=UPI001C62C575|nr:PIN domain-containing protein [Brevundimonas sp. PAMC22021]QYF87500.1 PIN domain-containing protein [Brevundimonas sp. PAMC22021]